jgi:hypothetical protein
MALFSGQDRETMALLSQFVQIELPEGWEDDRSKLIGSELDDLRVFWDVRQKVPLLEPAPGEPNPELPVVAYWLEWCQALLCGYADGAVPAWALEAFQKEYDIHIGTPHVTVREYGPENLNPRGLGRLKGIFPQTDLSENFDEMALGFWPFKPNHLKPEALIPVSRVDWFDSRQGRQHYDLLMELLTQILACITRQSKVRRCVECNHPFVVKSGKQEYCSNRCSSRVRVRWQTQRARGKLDKTKASNLTD